MKIHEFYSAVQRRVDTNDERWGQAAYNVLSEASVPGIVDLAGTLDDPYYRVKTKSSLKRWVAGSVSVDCVGTVIGVGQPS